MAITGNKGEWSEPYALLKLLADGKLFLGDENFEKVKNVFYPILKVLRHEKNRTVDFSYDQNLVVINNGKKLFKIAIKDFITNAALCFKRINEAKKGKGAFAIPEIENFLSSFSITTLKAKSKLKNDITIQIEDPNTFISPTLGFSIKSQLGRASTLLNASGPTNFTYRIVGHFLTKKEIGILYKN
jgi:type II restriction enzyme